MNFISTRFTSLTKHTHSFRFPFSYYFQAGVPRSGAIAILARSPSYFQFDSRFKYILLLSYISLHIFSLLLFFFLVSSSYFCLFRIVRSTRCARVQLKGIIFPNTKTGISFFVLLLLLLLVGIYLYKFLAI